jgi:hypothetical protein
VALSATVKVATKNFFVPLQTNNMVTDAPDTESITEKAVQEKSGRPQKQSKDVAKDTFEFRSTKNGTKNMVDYQSVKTYFESKSYPTILFTLNQKSRSRQ